MRVYILALIMIAAVNGVAQTQMPTKHPAKASTVQVADTPLGKEQLISPEDLLKSLQSSAPKPLILSVGPRLLFAQAHIPGAEFIGQGSEPQSLEALKVRVKALPKKKLIVLYCGCCPWVHCPNVEPAYKQLRSLGFTNVKVLFLATNLGVDWVYKGYPSERGQ